MSEIMNDVEKSVSVVIPVKNEVLKIADCLNGILNQTVKVSEIIVVDSGSTDGTKDIVKSFSKIKLIEIPASEFNHGLTRYLGFKHTQGKYIIFTVGDARPVDKSWIDNLLGGFIDKDVAGVCGQQIVPHDRDKNPVQWFRPASEPKLEEYQFENPGAFDKLTPEEKKRICGWDDVTACYRREALLKVPFREINFAEDAAWAMDALRAGYKIVYNKKARVYHYHDEYPDFAFRRSLTVFYHRYKLFGTVPSEPTISFRRKLSMANTLLKSPVSFSDKMKWWKYNVDLVAAQRKAYGVFILALKKSEIYLDEIHKKYCDKPPQAVSVRGKIK